MTAQKCVVEGCNLEYDVICSFSFYNVNTTSEVDKKRQEWIDGAMQEDSECLWRHVSLQLCGYHFELDAQGLWIDSPMLPELLARRDPPPEPQTAEEKKAAETIRLEHNYSAEPASAPRDDPASVSRLNVRHLVDTLGYLSLKNLQRKQLWVVKVETESAEASITQAEQVIAKLPPPKQVIEIVPQTSTSETVGETSIEPQNEVLHMIDDSSIPDNFIYEIAEEQEITMEEVKEIPPESKEWSVNIVPEEKPKYAYIKHCATGKKKRHFTAEMNEITLQGDFENYYILPDVDPSVGVEITTSYEPENYIVEEYQHLVLDERPKKRAGPDPTKKKKKKVTPIREPIKHEVGEDWVIQNDIVYEQDGDDFADKESPNL
ncbi:hypothetical protein NE865_08193 [Phthorimaea operculella]|nr:hypothetical protein NE865_08193 [Phthorimaea operculella]